MTLIPSSPPSPASPRGTQPSEPRFVLLAGSFLLAGLGGVVLGLAGYPLLVHGIARDVAAVCVTTFLFSAYGIQMLLAFFAKRQLLAGKTWLLARALAFAWGTFAFTLFVSPVYPHLLAGVGLAEFGGELFFFCGCLSAAYSMVRH